MTDVNKLSQDEVNSILEKCNNEKSSVVFTYYYKYTFHYSFETESYLINVSYGGISDDIYRHTVSNNEHHLVPLTIDEFKDNFNYGEITRKSDNATYTWNIY